jgi:hypothetical protein
MAQKFEILKDDFLKITDTVTSQIKLLEPKSNVFYNASNLNVGQIKMYSVKGVNKFSDVIFETTIGQAIDGSDVVFTAQTFEDFCTDSKLGFKAASGGSGADSYEHIYAAAKIGLHLSGNFVGMSESSNPSLDINTNMATQVSLNAVKDSKAKVIGITSSICTLDTLSLSIRYVGNVTSLDFVVGYRDKILSSQTLAADSLNPVVIETKSETTIAERPFSKDYSINSSIQIPANKEIVLCFRRSDSAGQGADLWHCLTQLTFKKV